MSRSPDRFAIPSTSFQGCDFEVVFETKSGDLSFAVVQPAQTASQPTPFQQLVESHSILKQHLGEAGPTSCEVWRYVRRVELAALPLSLSPSLSLLTHIQKREREAMEDGRVIPRAQRWKKYRGLSISMAAHGAPGKHGKGQRCSDEQEDSGQQRTHRASRIPTGAWWMRAQVAEQGSSRNTSQTSCRCWARHERAQASAHPTRLAVRLVSQCHPAALPSSCPYSVAGTSGRHITHCRAAGSLADGLSGWLEVSGRHEMENKVGR